MGANEEEEAYFMKRLEFDDVKMLPKKVTTEYSIPERQKLYLDGGVLFVTTRIMVVDMLTDRMPMCKSYGQRAFISVTARNYSLEVPFGFSALHCLKSFRKRERTM